MITTSNYNLIIPSKNDICKASDLENDLTILDTELKNINNKLINHYHSIDDITGTLGIANGGTGATTKTAAVNNLCEVGTWTPRLTNVEGSAPTYTTGWNYGSYLKIGTLVWVWCDMALGISNIGGNYAGVSGLPYANDGSCGLHLVEAYEVLNLGRSGDIYPNTSVIDNIVRFRTPAGENSYNWKINTSQGTNVGRLRFSGIYRTT